MRLNDILSWININIRKAFNIKNTLLILGITMICTLVYSYNKLLFHFLSESYTVLIGFLMLVVATNVSEASENGFFSFLAIGFGYVGAINLLHVINYEGINIISKSSLNISIQLGAISTYIQAISMAIAFKFINKKVDCRKITYIYMTAITVITLVTYTLDISPAFYLEGYGQTVLNHWINIFSCLIFIFPTYLLYKHKNELDFEKDNYTVILSMIFTVLSRVFLIFYIDPNGIIAFLAHVCRVLSFYFLYKSIMKLVLREPYNILFKGLNDRTCKLEEINKELNIKNNQLETTRDRLEKSKERYKQLVKSLPDSILIRCGEEIVFVNNATVNLLNAKNRSEIIGNSMFSIIHDKYIDEFKENFITVENKKQRFLNLELMTLDGNRLDTEICEIETVFENKLCNLMVIRNMSERKKFYELKAELDQKIESEKIRTEFFANLSHELRTPINVIYSALQLEDIYIKKNDISGIEKYNEIVKQNCYRLLRMCNNLIDITKIDTGLFKPCMKHHNIVYIVESIVSSVSFYVKSKNIDIVFDTSVEESYVLCDPNLIERIILNLLSNAVKYGKENGNISVDIYDRDNEVILNVKDDGIGIPDDEQDTIFERFSQVDKSLRRKCEGSGLGLSLVKSLVELQNGNISLKSKIGEGSEFMITFPKTDYYDEVCATTDELVEENKIIESVNIEFSDIYLY
ncbi:sensor histidine kinase ResE [Gottschalkia purinilytica]|uniref:histidine kinase n=1 Tax=Gottschalkia purinilytica TaxID=1503 RepID=A0A0L0WC44_GOTPU|nr:MASE3 domain-containing protein [Gottschalkia purinilytica]KNF08975.1 sensor histidine kinase ResE [Gottschalkia purinilytica]